MKFRIFTCVFMIGLVMMIASAAGAATLKVAVGLALPPYVISENNTGMELDIVREVLKSKGYDIEPVYVPFARVPLSIEKKEVDAALTVTEAANLKDTYFSESHIMYQNVAVTLKENNVKIDSIADLKDKRVVAFQNATVYLGEEYKNIVSTNKNYSEVAKQENQVTLLFLNRADAIVMDINIFKYYKKQVTKADTSKEVEIHSIFPESHYKVGFLDKAVMEKFNEGLKELKASGRYDAIIKSYIK